MDRLGVVDSSFLFLEDGTMHLHIGSCAVFEGPVPSSEEFLGLMAAKLDGIPRYRQRVHFTPLQLDRPTWVDDDGFRLADHLHRAAVPHPGGRAELEQLVAWIMSAELDREKALWETWLVEGLGGGRWAMVSKVHHCMVDGVSGTDLLAAVLQADGPGPAPAPVPPGPPAAIAEPTPDRRRSPLRRLAQLPLHPLDTLAGALRTPITATRHVAQTTAGWAGYAAGLRPTPANSLAGDIGAERRWTSVSVPLEELKAIRSRHGCTVNDVVVSAVTGGMRALLRSRGEDAEGLVLRALVPVSIRATNERGTYNNRVSAVFADLPVGVDDPVERLHAVQVEMRRRKASHEVDAGRTVEGLGRPIVFPLLADAEWLAARLLRGHPQHSVNTVVTNVPGPQFPLSMAGRRMVEYLPFVPIAHGMRVGTAVVSYDGNVAFGITADYTSVPDLAVMAVGIEAEIDALNEVRAAELTPSPPTA
ncbi:MAG: WS/DGAT/MGAT family O-acyltransferase [Acidimicrobiales bacterium]